MKQTAAKSMIQAIHTVCQGRICLSEELRNGMIKRPLDKPESGDLTRLKLSPNTIETYRLHIKQKLGLSSSAELHRTAFLHFQNGSS